MRVLCNLSVDEREGEMPPFIKKFKVTFASKSIDANTWTQRTNLKENTFQALKSESLHQLPIYNQKRTQPTAGCQVSKLNITPSYWLAIGVNEILDTYCIYHW